jgi:predicted nuclease of predicted toxin-antitoxin system
MKLLCDENLSPKLPALLEARYPGSAHVRDCDLKGSSDDAIWEYARANNFTILSKDSDFYQRSLLFGPPPKLIWLRIGNCTRDDVLALLARHDDDIRAFEASPKESILVLA